MGNNPDGLAEARLRIAAEAVERTGQLDLAWLGLEGLPAELFALTHLQELALGRFEPGRADIGANRPGRDLAKLDRLPRLRALSLHGTQIRSLAPLAGLASLQSLDCSGTQVRDLAPLAGLASLQALNCSDTQVWDLAPLAGLASLQSLNCAVTQVRDLAPLAGLASLQSLTCSHTEVQDLAPLAGLPSLEYLDCDETQVADLAPLLGLARLRRLDCRGTRLRALPPEIGRLGALRRLDLRDNAIETLPASLGRIEALATTPGDPDRGGEGLHLEGNPLQAPLPALIAPGQPQATRNVLAWLRRELDPAELALELAPAPPPDMPNPGAGLHIQVDAFGTIAFAPPEALDAAGNHVPRLRSLHPELCAALDELLAAFDAWKPNAPPGPLESAVEAYAEIARQPLDEMDFHRLYARGVRLRNAEARRREAIGRDAELPLPLAVAVALDTLLDLHGPFIRATKAGVELSADEEADKGTPEDRRAQREAAIALAERLQDQPALLTPEVAQEVLAAAQAGGEGPNPARSSVIASAQVRHVATAMLSMAAAAGVAAGAFAAAGPGAGVLVGLLAIEPIKASRGYAYVRDFLTRALNRLGEADPTPALEALRRHNAFVRQQAASFERLGALGGRFAFIGRMVDWIRVHAFELPKPIPPRPKPRPPTPPQPASA
jgi:hypothetical protein